MLYVIRGSNLVRGKRKDRRKKKNEHYLLTKDIYELESKKGIRERKC